MSMPSFLKSDSVGTAVGYFGLAAVSLMVVTDLTLAFALPGKSLFSTTISNLAAGRHSLWQDISLIAVALACVASGLVLFYRLQSLRAKVGAVLLSSVGATILLLAVYNEYGDNDTGGLVIHLELVGFIGIGLAITMCLLADELQRIRNWLKPASYIGAATWLVTGLIFFGVSTSIDGLVERSAAAVMLIWLSLLCYGLIRLDRSSA